METLKMCVCVCVFFLRSAAVYQYLLQVPHQPSSAAYFDAFTVQRQSLFMLFPV